MLALSIEGGKNKLGITSTLVLEMREYIANSLFQSI